MGYLLLLLLPLFSLAQTCPNSTVPQIMVVPPGQTTPVCTPFPSMVINTNGNANLSLNLTAQAEAGTMMLHRTGDFYVHYQTSTQLIIGQICSITNPCNFGMQGQIQQMTNALLINLVSGSGQLYVFLTNMGVGLGTTGTLLVTCSGNPCSNLGTVTGFPLNTTALYTWQASNGIWMQNSEIDWRCFLCWSMFSSGFGLVLGQQPGVITIGSDTKVVPFFMPPPANSSATCPQPFTLATDGTYLYLCTTQNSWMRVQLTSF